MNGSVTFDVERIGPWVCARAGGTHIPGSSQAIGLERDGELVAGVLYDQFNGRSVCMHVAADVPDWVSRKFLRLCFDYPFNQMGVNKVVGLVDSTNTRALSFDMHLGFVEEARLSDAGKEGDLVILTMTKEQCRWAQ